MYEVELKVRADHDSVRAALADRGADHRGRVVQEDVYYDAPHRDFAETDEALRVRTERHPDGERTELTYKGPLVDDGSKTREEAETGVQDPDAVRNLLAGLGFDPAATVHKERDRFEYDGHTVTLDSVEGLGEFVEVETAVDSEGDVPEARDGAREVMDTLGLDPSEQIRTSYLGLLLSEDTSQ